MNSADAARTNVVQKVNIGSRDLFNHGGSDDEGYYPSKRASRCSINMQWWTVVYFLLDSKQIAGELYRRYVWRESQNSGYICINHV